MPINGQQNLPQSKSDSSKKACRTAEPRTPTDLPKGRNNSTFGRFFINKFLLT